MTASSKIKFFFEGVRPHLPDRTNLKAFIERLIRTEGGRLTSLNYVFCTDQRLLVINRQYLGHNEYTDIVTFNLSESATIEGEVYISVDRVRENAQKLKITFREELLRVIFHGALHLTGYKDKTKAQINEMRKAENLWIARYLGRVPRGTTAK